jgi:hypothetical protein
MNLRQVETTTIDLPVWLTPIHIGTDMKFYIDKPVNVYAVDTDHTVIAKLSFLNIKDQVAPFWDTFEDTATPHLLAATDVIENNPIISEDSFSDDVMAMIKAILEEKSIMVFNSNAGYFQTLQYLTKLYIS